MLTSSPVFEALKKSGELEQVFPYSWDESGRCEMLSADNKCMVYYDRPTICSVENMADLMGIDRAEYFVMSAKACNQLMDENGIPEEFRIKAVENVRFIAHKT